MKVSWARLPRLLASAPKKLGLSQPEGTAGERGRYTPKMFSVEGPRRAVNLTEREWDLLSLLFEYRGSYLTRETILSRVWGPYYVSQAHLFDEALTSLRASLRKAGYPNDLIREQRGLGVGIPDVSSSA